MSNLDKYFTVDTTGTTHPRARHWRTILERKKIQGSEFDRSACELWRERDGLTFRPAKIYLHFYDSDNNEVGCEDDAWDEDVNRFLIDMGVKAISADNEKDRFGLMIRSLLRKPESLFGDGFFNSVILMLLQESGFARLQPVSEALRMLHDTPPSTKGRSYADCRDMIENVLSQCGHDIVQKLGYTKPEAEKILAGAIAYFLDERFSITNRKLLGLG